MQRGAMKSLILLCLVGACASSEPQISASSQPSSDPILRGVINSFQEACIENAPSFAEAAVRPAFERTQPDLPAGMSFIATWQFEQNCRVTVRNYGRDRPMLTVGDVNGLALRLQSKVGGNFKADRANTAGGAQVRGENGSFHVSGYLGNDGDLTLSVFD